MEIKFIKTRMPEEGNNVRWQKYGKKTTKCLCRMTNEQPKCFHQLQIFRPMGTSFTTIKTSALVSAIACILASQ
jgi:hypothetical protein